MKLVGPDPVLADEAVPKSYVDAAAGQKVTGVVLDFGAGEGETTATGTAFASWAAAGLQVVCLPDPAGTADHDAQDAVVEGVAAVVVYVEPGIGFDVVASCPNGTWGRYLFTCVA